MIFLRKKGGNDPTLYVPTDILLQRGDMEYVDIFEPVPSEDGNAVILTEEQFEQAKQELKSDGRRANRGRPKKVR